MVRPHLLEYWLLSCSLSLSVQWLPFHEPLLHPRSFIARITSVCRCCSEIKTLYLRRAIGAIKIDATRLLVQVVGSGACHAASIVLGLHVQQTKLLVLLSGTLVLLYDHSRVFIGRKDVLDVAVGQRIVQNQRKWHFSSNALLVSSSSNTNNTVVSLNVLHEY
jgi:hypothetical protein